MENYDAVTKFFDFSNFEQNSMKSISLYILILGISLSLVMFLVVGYVVGLGVGLNALVFSGSSWIIGSAMIVEEE